MFIASAYIYIYIYSYTFIYKTTTKNTQRHMLSNTITLPQLANVLFPTKRWHLDFRKMIYKSLSRNTDFPFACVAVPCQRLWYSNDE